MSGALIRNLPDGRYELYCPVCDSGRFVDLPISMDKFATLVKRFAEAHDHDARCEWQLDDEDANTYKGSCGILWSLTDGTPADNRMNYCPRCGKEIKDVG